MRRVTAAVVAAAVLVAAAGAVASSTAAGSPLRRGPAAGCVVRYVRVQFAPSTVVAGASTALQVTMANCTRRTQVVTDTVFGREPCAVLDPVAHGVTLRRRARVRSSSEFLALGCPGTASVTTRLTDASGTTLDERTATFTIVS